jgi:hypothetical protein
MATSKQKTAARKNVKKTAAAAVKGKKTITHVPKTRTALGKQATKAKSKAKATVKKQKTTGRTRRRAK